MACKKSLINCREPFLIFTLEQFNEETYYKKIADTLRGEASGLTAVKLAEKLRINVVLMKEHIEIAEERGFVCRDESYEGVLWFDNKFTKLTS